MYTTFVVRPEKVTAHQYACHGTPLLYAEGVEPWSPG